MELKYIKFWSRVVFFGRIDMAYNMVMYQHYKRVKIKNTRYKTIIFPYFPPPNVPDLDPGMFEHMQPKRPPQPKTNISRK